MKKNPREESLQELGKHFELSIIKRLTDEETVAVCKKAIEYNLAGVFCGDYQVPLIREALKGSDLYTGVGVCFPAGSGTIEGKVADVAQLTKMGAQSIDYVMNVRQLLNGHPDIVRDEARAIRDATDQEVKVIVECCLLDDDQLKQAIEIAVEAKLNVVKSSTGQLAGPTFEQACLMVDMLKGTGLETKVAGVKAPRPQNAMVYLLAGIDRIGTQQAFGILDGIPILRERGIF